MPILKYIIVSLMKILIVNQRVSNSPSKIRGLGGVDATTGFASVTYHTPPP